MSAARALPRGGTTSSTLWLNRRPNPSNSAKSRPILQQAERSPFSTTGERKSLSGRRESSREKSDTSRKNEVLPVARSSRPRSETPWSRTFGDGPFRGRTSPRSWSTRSASPARWRAEVSIPIQRGNGTSRLSNARSQRAGMLPSWLCSSGTRESCWSAIQASQARNGNSNRMSPRTTGSRSRFPTAGRADDRGSRGRPIGSAPRLDAPGSSSVPWDLSDRMEEFLRLDGMVRRKIAGLLSGRRRRHRTGGLRGSTAEDGENPTPSLTSWRSIPGPPPAPHGGPVRARDDPTGSDAPSRGPWARWRTGSW